LWLKVIVAIFHRLNLAVVAKMTMISSKILWKTHSKFSNPVPQALVKIQISSKKMRINYFSTLIWTMRL
jgi:DNA-binding phage protein